MRSTTGADTPSAIGWARPIFEPAVRASVERLADHRVRLVAGYQLGQWDADGAAESGGGKAVRPALALLAARAVCGSPEPGVAAAVAVELIHNFSLLHDDIMDRDVERRHRPTGWVVFGEGQAILAGNAMMGAAFDVLLRQGPHPERTLPVLLDTVQALISGQSADLHYESDDTASVEDILTMEEGKTAALIAGSLALGALSAGAEQGVVDGLHEVGRLIGIAFQLIDDVLGVVGDPAVTGKSASSDVRAGKRSVPVVVSLRADSEAAHELGRLLAGGPPTSEVDIARAVELIERAGGVAWANAEAQRLLDEALDLLAGIPLADEQAVAELREVAEYLIRRNR
ncbi:polyprenyl synthetase family protein [uncultured Jatrophihabitans sp.]|uniref:polyprenyl synthetase family protein n=1 Tax=uncultured Jatrophihabitans sp. TaxID=1610747 RepID=UPI0035CC741F